MGMSPQGATNFITALELPGVTQFLWQSLQSEVAFGTWTDDDNQITWVDVEISPDMDYWMVPSRETGESLGDVMFDTGRMVTELPSKMVNDYWRRWRADLLDEDDDDVIQFVRCDLHPMDVSDPYLEIVLGGKEFDVREDSLIGPVDHHDDDGNDWCVPLLIEQTAGYSIIG